METTLVLDPGASTGYAFVDFDDAGNATITRYGTIDVDTSSEYLGDWCIDLEKKLDALIHSENNLTHVAVEDYFFSSRFASGCNVNTAYRTIIYMWARETCLKYTILNITNWKTFVAGRSVPTKQQVKQWGKQPAKKLFIQQALWERFKIRFPNHSISSLTGKPIAFKSDIIDVVGQAVYYALGIKGATSITSVVPVPPDVPMKKSKKTFVY